eukprot:Nk52_evm10s217 gene=Nk52_evmTU10s217
MFNANPKSALVILFLCTILNTHVQLPQALPVSGRKSSPSFYNFRIDGELVRVPLGQPNGFLKDALSDNGAAGSNTPSNFVKLAVAERTDMAPSTFAGNSFIGYDSRTGSPVLNSAFEKVRKVSVVNSTYSENAYAMDFDSSSQEKLNKVAVGIGGAFMGAGLGLDISSASMMKTEGTTVKIRAMMRQDIRTEGISTFDDTEVVFKKEASDLLVNNPEAFMSLYGTHAIISKTYGCMSTLEGVYHFSSTEKTDSFKTTISAGLDVGIFSLGASTEIENTAKKTDSKFAFTATLQGDVTGIRPNNTVSLPSWAEALQKNFQNECQLSDSIAIKYVTALSWNVIENYIKTKHASLLPALTVNDFTNIALGARRNNAVIMGYNRFIVGAPGFGEVQWVSNMGTGACVANAGMERDPLLGPHGSIVLMQKETLKAAKSWLPAYAMAKGNLTSQDLSMYALKYAFVDANANVEKYARLTNQARAYFTLKFPSHPKQKPLSFSIYNLNFNICYSKKTNSFSRIAYDESCPLDAADANDRSVRLALNTGKAPSSAGVLSYKVRDNKGVLQTGTITAYNTKSISFGEKSGSISALVTPQEGLEMNELGYVPCSFRI